MLAPCTSSYAFSRRQMYEKIEKFLYGKTESRKCLFVGEDSTSGILTMIDNTSDIMITNKHNCDTMNIPFPDCSFDIVVSDQVIEHVENPFTAVEEMLRVTIPGGVSIITTCFMNPIHCNDSSDECEDFWRFTPDGLRILCKGFSQIHQSAGMGDFKLLYYCTSGHREDRSMDSDLVKIAKGNDGRTYIHTWIIAEK